MVLTLEDGSTLDVPLLEQRWSGTSWMWHRDPNYAAIVLKLITDLKPKNIIETGTWKGDTTTWFATLFPDTPVYSTELIESSYDEAKVNCAKNPNITLSLGDSVSWLKSTMLDIIEDGLNFFYLDAHGFDLIPVPGECDTISKLDKYVVVLDDFQVKEPYYFNPDWYNNIPICKEMIADTMGHTLYGPNYKPLDTYKGYGIYVKGVDFTFPSYIQKITF